MTLSDNILVEAMRGLSRRDRAVVEAHIKRGVKTTESRTIVRRLKAQLKKQARAGK